MQSTVPRLWAVVPAAGIGSRMGAQTAKQYLPLAGCTVIEQTLRKLQSLNDLVGIMVAVRESDPIWPTLAISQEPTVLSTLGGEERAQSVLLGLKALASFAQEDDWVLVHDAARPCVAPAVLRAFVDRISQHSVGGILAVRAADTLKRAQAQSQDGLAEIDQTVDRGLIWQAQTPQMFRLGVLRDAIESGLAQGHAITDEASAMEFCGHRVGLFEGQRDNLKITTPEDLPLAEFILQQQGFSCA